MTDCHQTHCGNMVWPITVGEEYTLASTSSATKPKVNWTKLD